MLRAIFFAPVLFILVLFALSNPQIVHLAMWPTDFSVDLPLSVAILLAMASALIVGALMPWVTVVGARLRARRSESRVRQLEARVAELEAKLETAPASVNTSNNRALALSAQE